MTYRHWRLWGVLCRHARLVSGVVVIFMVLAVAFTARATIVRPEATCSLARIVMESGNQNDITALSQFIIDSLYEAGRPFVQAKRGSVLPTNDGGVFDLIAMITGTCASHMNQSLKAHTIDFYRGWRSLISGG